MWWLWLSQVQMFRIMLYKNLQVQATRSQLIPRTSGQTDALLFNKGIVGIIYSTCLSFLIEFIMQGGDNSCRGMNMFALNNI